MTMRPRTSICPEGWYYIFVVLFIMGGAVLREVNLLVLLAGVMVAPLVLNWRMVRSSMFDLRVSRRTPRRIMAGERSSVAVVVRNARRRLPAWAVVVEDRVERVRDQSKGEAARVHVIVPHVPARETRTVRYQLRLSRRGLYRFGPMRATTRFPLGLLRASVSITEPQDLIVLPQQGKLSRTWREIARSGHMGSERAANRKGLVEGDYYGLREWRPGDSQRWIHWRTSAKMGRLAVRQFERQRHRDVSIVLDLCRADGENDEQAEAGAELAVSFAATVVAEVCRQGDMRLLFGLCAETRDFWASLACQTLADSILASLAVAQPGSGSELRNVIEGSARYSRYGAGAVVISTRSPVDVGTGDVTWVNVNDESFAEYFSLSDEVA